MTENTASPSDVAGKLRRPLILTRWGMVAERCVRAFWPLWSILLLALAALMFGVQDAMPLELLWGGAVLLVLAAGLALVAGVRAFRWPSVEEALERLDDTLPGRPIATLRDTQAIGAGDAASEAVWSAHVDRMAARAAGAKPVPPDLRAARRDPYALRYVAVLAFAMALIFGSFLRVASVAEMTPGGGSDVAGGPSWEGWIEPPAYTGKPALYLADLEPQTVVRLPQGSRVTVRLYGEVGALRVEETVSGRMGEGIEPATAPSQAFDIANDGRIAIEGPGGASWEIAVTRDAAPEIELSGAVERTPVGEMRQPFHASDDYGVVSGRAEIALDLDAVERAHGLAVDPEPMETLTLDLPMTITGDRTDFEETLIENLAQHPLATLPVTIQLFAEDAGGQEGASVPTAITLPGRRFFDPLAGAIAEQRRDLLWNRVNAERVAQILRAISYQPDDIFTSATAYLKLRVAIRRLEIGYRYGILSDERRDEIAQALWDIAVMIEEGNLSDALERLRRAQDRLAEAMRNGATDEEIAELMQELREAMQDYMRQLAEQQGQQDGQEMAQNPEDMQEITGDQLNEMLERLQELMEQGRMAEAQQLLDQLRQMMENMQVAQGQQGQGQQSPGEQAMEGLAETLREQQGLSDEAFRDLQEQFNPGAQAGENQGNEGRNGGQGRGQSHEGQGGQGQGDGEREGQQGQAQNGEGGDPRQSLADRQRALRQELGRQSRNLPGQGTAEGDAARDALDRAGRAMDRAEDALREDDLAGAIDDQAEAMEALREGMRNLGDAMAQQQQQQGQQGDALGRADPQGRRDPLGRDAGDGGNVGTEENLLQGDDVYRRARELLDEIRRRSSDQTRPEAELDYLRRLLDRF